MQERGYRIIPVNPRAAGGRFLEKRCMLACRRFLPSRYRRCIPTQWVFTRCGTWFYWDGCENFLGTIGAGKSRSRRNPSWSWTRRYRHEPLYQTGTHPTDLRRLPIRFINDKQLIIEENPSLLGFSSYSYSVSWLEWPVKWRGPCLICLIWS